ncbi:TetR/AcrR family transcriptional regulator [Limnohabitans sp.]|jgi:AcrR family transcriptional regulator|uniref:TetR/AcrR family transcriptional regulator n=1 Tax=Limnohabitans sp. TaxID=1907725 RepID=UPI002FDE21EE
MALQTLISSIENTHKRERRKQARPGELLDAALDLFVEKGFSAARVDEVAARAGVSKGTLFLYFQSKEDLFKAVVRENIVHQFPKWQEEFVLFQGSSADMLRYALLSWWERIGKTRASGIAKLVMSEAQNFPEIAEFYQEEVIQPGNAMIRRILERGMHSGEFRLLDLEQAVHIIVAPMIFLMMWKHSMGACAASAKTLDPEQFIHMQVDVLLHGITTPKT